MPVPVRPPLHSIRCPHGLQSSRVSITGNQLWTVRLTTQKRQLSSSLVRALPPVAVRGITASTAPTRPCGERRGAAAKPATRQRRGPPDRGIAGEATPREFSVPSPLHFRSLDRLGLAGAYARLADKAGDVVNAKPRHQQAAVRLGGFHADTQVPRNGLGGHPPGDQAEDLAPGVA